MKQSLKVFQHSQSLWESFLEWNPQLFRELKGKLKPRNIVIAAAISIFSQLLIICGFLGQLPESAPQGVPFYTQYSRYCYGVGRGYGSRLCETDLLNNWVINWQLFWLDVFITLSIAGIFCLLGIGVYLLITDTVKEESRGTLNFIRLTPRTASSILTGKILGVPILMYLVVSMALPLHLASGLGARIPLGLILGFDAIVIASCAFFYSAALLWSLINFGLSGFKPWLASGGVCLFLFIFSGIFLDGNILIHNNLFDVLALFYPGTALSYLTDATYLSSRNTSYLSADELKDLLFYGQALWTNATVGMGLILLNFGLWTYWLWSALKRRFHNPQSTLLSKSQSYWVTGCFAAVAVGFTLQTTQHFILEDNFAILQLLMLFFFLGLTAALSPHRQTLQDWARYRHQQQREGHLLWKELVLGENSPSTVAIAINLFIATVYILPSLLFFTSVERMSAIFWGLILTANISLLYAIVAQLLLTISSQKRAVWATAIVSSIIAVPPIGLGLAEIMPKYAPGMWLFTFVPAVATEHASLSAIMLAILGQWLLICVVGFQMTRKLRQAGASETKMLLDHSKF